VPPPSPAPGTAQDWLVRARAKLTAFATLARYPGLIAPASEANYNEAIKIAEDVVAWAESLVP